MSSDQAVDMLHIWVFAFVGFPVPTAVPCSIDTQLLCMYVLSLSFLFLLL